MIVPMKKVYLIAPESSRQETLEKLQEVGVVHLAGQGRGSESLERLREQRSLLERALALFPTDKKAAKRAPQAACAAVEAESLECRLQQAEAILALADRVRSREEELERLRREEERLAPWGDFQPADLGRLEEKGIRVRLYELTLEQYRRFPEGFRHWVVGRTREAVRVAAVALAGEPLPELPEVPLPAAGLQDLRQRACRSAEELSTLRQELAGHRERAEALRRSLADLADRSEFEQARADMETAGRVAYLGGFVPVDAVDRLRQTASREGWALLVGEPAADEAVPTLIRNPRWVRIIDPVFRVLDTVPGYREFDISFWFLLSFSLFFAMLIGDAAYGLLFLAAAIFFRRKMRDKPAEPFILMYVLSGATIIWGAITGTWFGMESIARLPFFSWFIIPQISTWAPESGRTVMLMCFLIGAVHLTIAHGINVVTFFPTPKAFANFGWLTMVWGMYFFVRYIVMGLPLHPLAPWLVAGGFLLITFFEEQQGHFLKGMAIGLAKAPLKLLNSISLFADIISYVRLFAVGLATVEIAKSFNAMALASGWGFPGGLITAFVLLLGHTLNIVMGGMSIVVHGVRLNMLEFSGHLGMEWSGFMYRPFSKRT